MPRSLLRIGLLALAGAIAWPAGAAGPVASGRPSLQALLDLAADPATPLPEVFAAAAGFGAGLAEPTGDVPAVVPPAMAAPGFSLVSIDLILSQLALQTGANNHVALRQALARPEVLILESGTTTLEGLHAAVTAAGMADVLSRTPEGIVAHVPIAVWTGATLSLAPGEALLLDRGAGAFLVSAGRLNSAGARIAASGEANPRLPDFAPFVVVALGGWAEIDDTDFIGLGFSQRPPMSGVTLVSGGVYPTASASFIRNSRFWRNGSLAVLGGQHITIDGNRFVGADGPALLLSGGSGAQIRHNLVSGTAASHGIKLTAGVEDAEVSGNIILGSAGNGIFAEAGVHDLTLAGNLVGDSALSGISIASAGCAAVLGNGLLGNRHSGLAIRASIGARVHGNHIADNHGAGVAIARQPGYAQVLLSGNVFDGNKVGIRASTGGQLVFAGNDLQAQAPRLVDGELVQFAARFFTAAAAGAALTIDGLASPTAQALPLTAPPEACHFPEGA